MKQPEWDLSKRIKELTQETGADLTEVINAAMESLKKEGESHDRT
jgi:hypothetical protein